MRAQHVPRVTREKLCRRHVLQHTTQYVKTVRMATTSSTTQHALNVAVVMREKLCRRHVLQHTTQYVLTVGLATTRPTA